MVDHPRSALISLVLVIVCVAGGQLFKGTLVSSRQGTVIAGGLGSMIFVFTLTALSNFKMSSAGENAKSGLGEVIAALFLALVSSALIHRAAATTCLFFSVVLLVALTGIAHTRYSTGAQAQVAAGKKRNFLGYLQVLSGLVAAVQFALLPTSGSSLLKPSLGVNLPSLCSLVDCTEHGTCLSCDFPPDCRAGETVEVNCTTNAACSRPVSLKKEAVCRYCWQTEEHEHDCDQLRNCSTIDVRPLRTTCRVKPHVVCMGHRAFHKNVPCDWTNGYSWSTALLLSITLGGFGADRFYLGLWKSAIGKMFSFGGCGVWTLVDIGLIFIGYLGPADGSRFL
ncbi:TM2 domain-containing protein [Aphelenchoides fujianensis]|nr:TM2 domain-containing protein [Aphelenchoides fujianensis]